MVNLNEYLPTLKQVLADYHPWDETETDHLEKTRQFLEYYPEPFTRATLAGHITASAVLIDESGGYVGLILHEKLGGWFQAGGHCEPDQDATVPLAALRELIEETEIDPATVRLLQETPFDIDVHPIPARGAEPDHLHYDIRYLFQAPYEALPQVAASCQWRPLADVLADPDESRARFARKLAAR